VDIIANILRAANSGAKKTHIMYRCNLSFKQLHVYLDLLGERRLLKCIRSKTEARNDSYTYETTSIIGLLLLDSSDRSEKALKLI